MEFKDKLKKLRTENGLSQQALADAVHISRSAIAKYEAGGGVPSEDTLIALSVYFGVEVSALKSDDDIKKDHAKKIWTRVGIVSLVVLLLGGLATGITFGAVSANQASGSSTPISQVTGIDAFLTIRGREGELPYHLDETTKEKTYTVTTFLDFEVTVFKVIDGKVAPYSIDTAFDGDVVTFSKDYQSYSLYYSAGTFDPHYSDAKYVLSFTSKVNDVTVEYRVGEWCNRLHFHIDDNSEDYASERLPLSHLYPWVDNVALSDIVSIRYSTYNGSLGPSFFREIYDSDTAIDIERAYAFFDAVLYRTNKEVQIPGSPTQRMEYILSNGQSYAIGLSGDGFSTREANYLVKKTFNAPSHYQKRYAFTPYGDSIKVVKLDDSSELPIAFLYDLEFLPWPEDEAYDETLEPTYMVSGYAGEEIEVYGPKRFSYQGKMYQIVSEQDFTLLF